MSQRVLCEHAVLKGALPNIVHPEISVSLAVLIVNVNQRTNGPVNAHLISWPSKTQNIQNLFCQFVLKILSKNQFLTSIKGRDSFANLRKTMIYNTNIDLVNDNVYTKFGLNRSIRFQDIKQKLNSDVNQGP